MNISIKSFDVEVEVKNSGVEFEVRDPQDNFLGDFIVTKANLIWCKGKTHRPNGKQVSWDDFISWIQSN